MPRSNRLGVLVFLVMLGLILSGLVDLAPRELNLAFLGSDLKLSLSGAAQLGIALAALVCAGVDSIIREHPLVRRRSIHYTVTFWVLPAALTLAGLVVLSELAWWSYRVLFTGAIGLLLALIITAEYHSVDPDDEAHWPARWLLNAAAYLAALILFTSLYGTRMRSVISATGVLLASSLLALDLLRATQQRAWRTYLYAVLVGLLMGEITWALNYCSIDSRIGGAILLLMFYCLAGLMQQHLWGRLSRRVVIEFGSVGAIGMGALMALSGWLRG